MDLVVPYAEGVYIPTCLLLTAVLVVLLYIYGKSPYGLWEKLGVPGPKPSLFLGNISDLFGPQSSKAAFAKWNSQFGRVYGIYYFRQPTLVITDPDLIKQVLVKDFHKFRNRLAYDNHAMVNKELLSAVFFAEGDNWKRIRGIVTPSFSIAKIKAMAWMVNRSAIRLGEHVLNCAKNKIALDAKLLYGAFTLDVVTATGFSIDVDSVSNLDEPFTRHGRSLLICKKTIKLLTLLAASFPSISAPVGKALNVGFFRQEDMRFFKENIKRLVEERNNEERESSKRIDFLQHMINAMEGTSNDSEGLTLEEVIAQGIIIFIAGYETASSTLQFLSYELARHPDILDKILEEIDHVIGQEDPTYDLCLSLKYTEATINETLRMYPPLSVLSRESEVTTTLNDMTLPPRTGIAIPLYNLGRDPEFWDNPDLFNPDRFLEETSSRAVDPFTFLPFGGGPRLCVGMKLGILEIKLALVQVLKRVVFTRATPEHLHINDFTTILQPSEPVMIHAIPRSEYKSCKTANQYPT